MAPSETRKKRKATGAIDTHDSDDAETDLDENTPLASILRSRPLYRVAITDPPDLDPSLLAYLRILTATEYEAEEGLSYSGELVDSVIGEGGTLWTHYEKERFFGALERCGPHDLLAIQSRVRTKTVFEIKAYMEILDTNSKQLGTIPDLLDECDTQCDHFIPAAFEMSDAWIAYEEEYASKLARYFDQACLANEMRQGYRPDRKANQMRPSALAYELRLSQSEENEITDLFEATNGRRPDDVLCSKVKDDLDRASRLFDVWAMSSLASNVYSLNPYTTIVTHSLVALYKHLREFLADIILDLYRTCRHNKVDNDENSVSRTLVRMVLKKRRLLQSLTQQRGRPQLCAKDASTLVATWPSRMGYNIVDDEGNKVKAEKFNLPSSADSPPGSSWHMLDKETSPFIINNSQQSSENGDDDWIVDDEDKAIITKNNVQDELLENYLTVRDETYETRLHSYISNPPIFMDEEEDVK